MKHSRLLPLIGLLFYHLFVVPPVCSASQLPMAISAADLDLVNCNAFVDAKPLGSPRPGMLQALLGLAPAPAGKVEWTTGPQLNKDLDFEVVFKAPMAIGTIITSYSGGRLAGGPMPPKGTWVAYLKPDVAFPGDLSKLDDWAVLPPGDLKLLPPGVKTRALRFHNQPNEWGYAPGGDHFSASMPYSVLLKDRYYTPLTVGYSKITAPKNQPAVWMGYWTDALPVVGFVAVPQIFDPVQVEYLKTDVTDHPLLSIASDWHTDDPIQQSEGIGVYAFKLPVTTKAIRLTTNQLPSFYPLVNLGDTPDAPSLQVPPPPFTFRYTMPMDGFAAVNVYDKSGKRVRRVIAEVARDKGVVNEHWDLRDDKGRLVPPGEYTYKAVVRPPFKLTYQLTPYNAGQPPWWAPPPGKGGGGWMADHTPPYCATTVGDQVFLASQVNESGSGVIAVDLQGNKLWGESFVTGFEIADRMASNGKYAYVMNNHELQRINPANNYHAVTVHEFNFTRELPGEAVWSSTKGGLAARGDKVYAAFNSPPTSWLQSSFLPDDLDPDKSFPQIWLARGNGSRGSQNSNDKNYSDETYDELMRFYAAFLTGSTPAQTKTWASTFLPSSTQAYFGDAPKNGPLSGMVTAVFKQPISVGSILVPDARIDVYALKPGAPIPGQLNMDDPDAPLGGGGANFNPDDWVQLTHSAKIGQASINLSPDGGLKTRALRFKTTRLVFALVMSHRMEDVSGEAERVYGEGQGTPSGGWSISRPATKPVNRFDPAVMGLVWNHDVQLRGVSFVQPRAGILSVEIWTGPVGVDPKTALGEDKYWSEIGRIIPEIFAGWYAQTPTCRNIDFGDILSVRALRIKALSSNCGRSDAVSPPWSNGDNVFDGIVCYHPIGHDAADLPVDMSQRITEFEVPEVPNAKAKILREIPFRDPGQLAFDQNGVLYTSQNGQIVTVPLDGGASKVVIKKGLLEKPAAMAFAPDGSLFVSDMGPQVVKVFDVKTGTLLRTIGKPGGSRLGQWDPYTMDRPTGITIDSTGRLWVTHNSYQPKRVSVWDADGKYIQSFLGPTQYGGGGTLDGGNKSVINYNGMEFLINWEKMDWQLNAILWRSGPGMSMYGPMPDRTIYYQGRRYLVGTSNDVASICVEKNHIAVPLAMAGNLGAWEEVNHDPALMKAFGSINRTDYGFVWYDKNGDGIPQADEVQIAPKGTVLRGPAVGEDMSFTFSGGRLKPTGFLQNGCPTYDIARYENLPLMQARSWELADGRAFTMADQWDRLLAPDGKTILWDYYDQFGVFAGFYASNYGYDRPPGVLNAEQSIFGHITDVGPNHEEFFVTSSDQGDWFCFTSDGFLVGCIFGGPTGYGLRRWTMPDWTPGKVDLSDLRLQQECYQGQVIRANDGNVYAVAGKNHMSIVKVEGLEKMQRLSGAFTVTAHDIEMAQAWFIHKSEMETRLEGAKVARVPYVNNPPIINGSLDDWPDDLFFTVSDYHQRGLNLDNLIVVAKAALSFDNQNLYLAVRALDDSPLENSADQIDELFKYGDAVDLQLALDPTADPHRTSPAIGDVRILLTRMKNKPVAVLYRYKLPNGQTGHQVHYASPVDSTIIDDVRVLKQVTLGIQTDNTGWTLEAAIPWASLGIAAPKIGMRMKGDVGVLQSDQNGVATINRLYWSGKSQRVVADTPAEARIDPSLWGKFYYVETPEGMKFGPDGGDIGADNGLDLTP